MTTRRGLHFDVDLSTPGRKAALVGAVLLGGPLLFAGGYLFGGLLFGLLNG